MAAVTVYNAFSVRRMPSKTTTPVVMPGSAPQHRQFASQRNLQSFAFNPAIDSIAFVGQRGLPFIRPDVPPVAEDSLKRGQGHDAETTAEASFKARPQFRSALEQVCISDLVKRDTAPYSLFWL